MPAFHRRLFELRTEQGWSQDALAAKLGVSKTTIQNWEGSANRPPHYLPGLARLVELAELWDVSTDYLLGRTDVREVCR